MEGNIYKRIKTKTEIDTLVEHCKKSGWASLDYESTGSFISRPWWLLTEVAISFQPGSSWVLELGHPENPKKGSWKATHTYLLEKLFSHSNIIILVYNAMYERRIFKHFNLEHSGLVLDVMLMKYLLDEERPNDLKSLVGRLLPDFAGYDIGTELGQKASEERVREFWGNYPIDELAEYNALDTDLTLRIGLHLINRLFETELWELFINMYVPLADVLSRTVTKGVMVDVEYLESLEDKYQKILSNLDTNLRNIPEIQDFQDVYIENKIEEYTDSLREEIEDGGLTVRQIDLRYEKISRMEAWEPSTKKEDKILEPFNFNSSKQLAEILYSDECLDLPLKDRTKTGNPSSSEDALLKLQPEDDTGFIKNLLELRGINKVYTTYVKNLLLEKIQDGRVHPSYLLHGTVTSRLSSRSPNIQNIPRCVMGDTLLQGRRGVIRIGDITPDKEGYEELEKGPEVLTHTGAFKRITHVVNKGYHPMVTVEDEMGNSLTCTTEHKLLTGEGTWEPVSFILKNNISIATAILPNNPTTRVTSPPPQEVIKNIEGYDGYHISNMGNIYSTRTKGCKPTSQGPMLIKSYRVSSSGYRNSKLSIDNRTSVHSLHTLVYKTFIGNIPHGFIVDHINGDKQCNWVTNLQAISQADNLAKGYKVQVGASTSHKNPLSTQDVLKARAMYKEGITYREIQNKLGWDLHKSQLSKILSSRRWGWLKTSHIRVTQRHKAIKVCDIQVEDNHSYITQNGFINHNTTSDPFLKGMFYANPGYYFIESDLSQAELRMVAIMANDKAMLETFAEGKNIHVNTAVLMFNEDYKVLNKARKDDTHPQHIEMIKKHKTAKVLNFAILYGMGPDNLALNLSNATGERYTKDDAIEFTNKWFNAFPQVKKWMAKIQKNAVNTGYSRNPSGFKRRFSIFDDPGNKRFAVGEWNAALRASVNAPIQGAASMLTQMINIEIYRKVLNGSMPPYLRLVSSVHDSLEFYVKKEDIHWYVRELADVINRVPELAKKYYGADLEGVYFKMGTEIGVRWNQMHEYDKDKDYVQEYPKEITRFQDFCEENGLDTKH